jgi:hypothetical protein
MGLDVRSVDAEPGGADLPVVTIGAAAADALDAKAVDAIEILRTADPLIVADRGIEATAIIAGLSILTVGVDTAGWALLTIAIAAAKLDRGAFVIVFTEGDRDAAPRIADLTLIAATIIAAFAGHTDPYGVITDRYLFTDRGLRAAAGLIAETALPTFLFDAGLKALATAATVTTDTGVGRWNLVARIGTTSGHTAPTDATGIGLAALQRTGARFCAGVRRRSAAPIDAEVAGLAVGLQGARCVHLGTAPSSKTANK